MSHELRYQSYLSPLAENIPQPHTPGSTVLSLPWPSSHVSWTCTGAAQAQRESNSCSARLTISDLLTGDKHMAKVLTAYVTCLCKQKQSQDNLSLQPGCLDAIWVWPAVSHFGDLWYKWFYPRSKPRQQQDSKTKPFPQNGKMGSTGKVSDSPLATVCSCDLKTSTCVGKTQTCIALQDAQHKAFERILELVVIPTSWYIPRPYRENSCHGRKTLKEMSALEQCEIWCSALKGPQVSKYLQRDDQDCLPSTVSIQFFSLPSWQNCTAWMCLSIKLSCSSCRVWPKNRIMADYGMCICFSQQYLRNGLPDLKQFSSEQTNSSL